MKSVNKKGDARKIQDPWCCESDPCHHGVEYKGGDGADFGPGDDDQGLTMDGKKFNCRNWQAKGGFKDKRSYSKVYRKQRKAMNKSKRKMRKDGKSDVSKAAYKREEGLLYEVKWYHDECCANREHGHKSCFLE